MIRTLGRIVSLGLLTEPAPSADESLRVQTRLRQDLLRVLGRALRIRHVDAGSCNGCELELQALANPFYNLEGLGIRFVASPRHADLLLVTGPVARQMEAALRRTYEAIPSPKLVLAVGDCGGCGGMFRDSAHCLGGVSKVIPVDVAVAGCPPTPLAVLQGILSAVAPVSGRPPADRTSR